MSGTASSIASLYSQFPDNTSGQVAPLNGRNLIATLANRTSIPFVTFPEFGADPSGAQDSSAAFTSAMAASQTIIVPPGKYKVQNCVIPSGQSIIGFGGVDYEEAPGSVPMRPLIVPTSSAATNIFIVDGNNDINIEGLTIDGTGATACNGISGGSTRVSMRNVNIQAFNGYAFGGAYAAGTNQEYTSQPHFYACSFFTSTNGLGNVNDAWITNCQISANTVGCNWTGGYDGAIHFVGNRVEWNTTYGIRVADANPTPGSVAYYGNKLNITGCQFDRNSIAGLFIDTGDAIAVTGCSFMRNGVNLDGNSCHILFNNAQRVMITGCVSTYGNNDDNSGVVSPTVWARFNGTSSNIAFVANDLTGYNNTLSNTNWRAGTIPTTGYIVSKNFGTGTAAQDIDTR